MMMMKIMTMIMMAVIMIIIITIMKKTEKIITWQKRRGRFQRQACAGQSPQYWVLLRAAAEKTPGLSELSGADTHDDNDDDNDDTDEEDDDDFEGSSIPRAVSIIESSMRENSSDNNSWE